MQQLLLTPPAKVMRPAPFKTPKKITVHKKVWAHRNSAVSERDRESEKSTSNLGIPYYQHPVLECRLGEGCGTCALHRYL